MSNTLLLKRSGVANTVPGTGSIALGELAINTYDGKLYTKIDNGVVSIVELTQNQTITLTGDVTGSGYSTINTTLANTAVTAGTYGNASSIPQFTVDSKGRITNATSFSISTSSISNGTSNVSIPVADGPVFISAAGVANVVAINLGGGTVTGFWSVTGNVSAGNISSTGSMNISGNVDAGNVSGTLLTGTLATAAQPNVTSVGTLTSLDVTGNIAGGNVSGTLLTGTLATAAQPNVTSVGTLTSLTTSGNVLAANINSNAAVTGVTGTFSGNVSGGNLTTAGAVIAIANVSGGNLISSGLLSVTGNANVGNLGTSGNINAGYFIGDGSQITNVTASSVSALTLTGNTLSSNVIFSSLTSVGTLTSLDVTGNIAGGNVSGTLLTGTLATAAQPNVTSVGTLTSLDVTGNIAGGNVSGTLLTGTLATAAQPNVTSVGTLTSLSVTGNITGGNVSGTLLTGTLATAAQPNVTSVGTLTSLSVTGNITGGNISAGSGIISTTGNVSGGNVISPIVTGGAGTLTLDATGDVVFAQSGNINATTSWINNLVDPVQAQDAATKQYVDNAVSTGITIHTPVRLETPVAIGGTYAQGGTTATVTDTVAGNTVVFSSAISPQVNDQYWFSNSFNGVVANIPYFVVSAPNTSAAVLSLSYSGSPVTTITSGSGLTQGVRINSGQGATLTNNGANVTLIIDGVTVANTDRILVYTEANAVYNGVYVVSEAGNATTAWQLTRASDMDTYIPDDINGLDAGDYFYVQEGDTGAGESYVMTAPIGPTIIGFDNLTFTQFSASQVYTANTAAGLILNGTVFSAKVDNNTTAFDGSGNIIVKASANLTTPNIGAATGTSLDVTGNISGGNLSGTNIIGTLTTAAQNNITSVGTLSSLDVTGNISGGNVSGTLLTGTLTNAAQPNVTSVGTLTSLSVTGNISGGNLSGTNIIGTLTTAAQNNITSVGTLTSLNVTGNANVGNLGTSGNITASYFLGNGSQLTGVIAASANAETLTGTFLASNVVGSSLTSVGNLTVANVGTLTVSTLANITATTAATSTTTGALTVAGGLGVVGNIYGGDIYKNGVIVLNANDTIDGGTY